MRRPRRPAACRCERQVIDIVSVPRRVTRRASATLRAGMIVSDAAIHIVTTRAAPLARTATRPRRRRRDVITDCSATVIGLLIGGRPFNTVAASYSLSRSNVVTRAQSGQVSQWSITAESGVMSLSDAVDSVERTSVQFIYRAPRSLGELQGFSR